MAKAKKFVPLILCVVMLFTGCGNKESTSGKKEDGDLYGEGLKVIDVMAEMIKSDEYRDLIANNMFEDILSEYAYSDYSKPVAVYEINAPSVEKMLNGNAKSNYDKLPSTLKDQLKRRMNFSTILSSVNAMCGSDKIAFTATFTASLDVSSDKDTTYLYVFEDGLSVAVTFTARGVATGQFVFAEGLSTATKVKSTFANCTVKEIDIPR